MLLIRMNLVAIPTNMGVEVQSARELGCRVVSEGKQGDTYHESKREYSLICRMAATCLATTGFVEFRAAVSL